MMTSYKLLPIHDVPIIFTFDNRFAKYSAVSMISLLIHATCRFYFVCIIKSISQENVILLASIARKFGCQILFQQIPPHQFSDWQVNGHLNEVNYFRIVTPKYVIADKALYLDSDTIVTCDISELLSLDIADHWLAGSRDPEGATTTRMPLENKDFYINSGVLLMNLKILRIENFEEQCKLVHQKFIDQIIYLDQCILNKVAEGHIFQLDRKWNMLAESTPPSELSSIFAQARGTSILHYNGPVKPWMRWANKEAADIWYSYARLLNVPLEEFRVKPANLKEWNAIAEEFKRQGDIKRSNEIKDKIIETLAQQLAVKPH